MVIKIVTFTLTLTVRNDYLQQVANQLGISRTRLARLLMEKIIREKLAAKIITEADVTADVPAPRYRRFKR